MADFVNDTFTDTSGTAITSHTGEAGASWTEHPSYANSDMVVSDANRLRNNVDDASCYYASGTPATAEYDVTVQLRVVSSVKSGGIFGRLSTSADTGYLANWSNNLLELFKASAGGYTQLGTYAQTWTAGQTYAIKLEIREATKKVYVDGVERISSSNNDVTPAGRVGVRAFEIIDNTSGFHIDSILASDASTVPLAAGTASMVSVASGTTTLACTAATGGTPNYTYQLQRGTDGVTFGTNVGSPRTTSGAPTNQASGSLTDGTAYAYRWQIVDSAGSPATVYTNTVWVVPHAAGAAFFVATAGSDSNNGLSGNPWQTITKVNRYGENSVLAGDSISFNGGDTFTGSARLKRGTNATTAGAPFVVGKYGSGAPTISASTSYGVWLENLNHARVQDLTVTGSGVTSGGVTTSVDAGIKATLSIASDLSGIVIQRNTVSGCFYGIAVTVAEGVANSILRPVVAFNTLADNGFAGIVLWHYPKDPDPQTLRITNPLVHWNDISDSFGVTDAAAVAQGDFNTGIWSGFGLMLYNCTGGLISSNLITRCGEASAGAGGGPVGILTVECNGVTIRGNEVSLQYAPDGKNGFGIDLDGGSVNCVVEGNWVHDCDGPGLAEYNIGGAYTANSGNVFRFNVTQNNGRRSKAAGISHPATFISITGGTNCSVYNNTDYMVVGGAAETKSIYDNSTSGAIFRNNNFSIRGSGATFGVVKNGTLLQGNNYDAASSATFSLTYNSVARTSLSDLRTVAETVNSINVGSTTAPAFTDAGGGVAVAIGTIHYAVPDYDSSELASIGLDVLTVFGVDPGPRDFHGNPPRSSAGYPVGAVAAAFPVTAGGLAIIRRGGIHSRM